MEVTVPVNPRRRGYPTCYKIDVANLDMKVGVEVDGRSHSTLARKKQDEKKTQLLVGLGWRVLRFTNQEVLNNLQACVQVVLSTISK
jgi:very-short-patch-repair endonuclease